MSIAPAFEAMLLMATEPTATEELAAAVGVPVAEAEEALAAIAAFYEEGARGIRLRRVAGGWRFATDPALADVLEAWLVSDQRSRLTQAALETLAVVAYLQPVSRGRIAGVRGALRRVRGRCCAGDQAIQHPSGPSSCTSRACVR